MKRLKHILDRNCLWLDLVDPPPLDVHFYNNAFISFPVETPFIVLRVKRKKSGYRINKLIKISERQLDEAVKSMVSDPKFELRYKEGSITVKDVEELVKIATYGTLSLDLFDY